MKVLFVIQKFESKPRLEDSAGYLEIARPLVASGKLDNYEYYHFGKSLKYYEKLIEFRVNKLIEELGDKPVVVYGAGAHTEYFNQYLSKLNLVAISDTEKSLWGKQCCGIQIIPPEKIPCFSKNVVISTRAFEKAVKIQLMNKFHSDLNIHTIYEHNTEYKRSWYQDICTEIEERVTKLEPDILLYTSSYPDERLPDKWFKSIRQSSPEMKIITVWWDYDESSGHNAYLEFEKASLEYCDYVVELGSPTRLQRMRNRSKPYEAHTNIHKIKFLSPPIDPQLFYPRKVTKNIDIAVFGSAVGARVEWIKLLSSHYKYRFNHIGGVYKNALPLPIEEYAKKLSETKIVVNTQTYPFRTCCKGKVKEALASGVFLLEEDNPESRAVVPEGKGVVYFSSFHDLIDKIDHYMINEEKREQIALEGYKWYLENIYEKWSNELLNFS